jgi:hypothetical protein
MTYTEKDLRSAIVAGVRWACMPSNGDKSMEAEALRRYPDEPPEDNEHNGHSMKGHGDFPAPPSKSKRWRCEGCGQEWTQKEYEAYVFDYNMADDSTETITHYDCGLWCGPVVEQSE